MPAVDNLQAAPDRVALIERRTSGRALRGKAMDTELGDGVDFRLTSTQDACAHHALFERCAIMPWSRL